MNEQLLQSILETYGLYGLVLAAFGWLIFLQVRQEQNKSATASAVAAEREQIENSTTKMVTSRFDEMLTANQTLTQSVAKVREEFAEYRGKAEAQVNALRDKLNANQVALDETKAQLVGAKMDAKHFKELADQNVEELMKLSTDYREMERRLVRLETDYKATRQELEQVREQKAAVELEKQALERTLDTQIKIAVDNALLPLQKQIATLEEQIALKDATIQSLTAKLEEADNADVQTSD